MSLPRSAQIVVSNDDLLTQILLCVPIKSLIRFTVVSNHWYDLIKDPKFCYLRSLKSNQALGLFLPRYNHVLSPLYDYIPFSVQNPSNPPFQCLQFVDATSGVSILQSCNGLLLCCSFRVSDFKNYKYYVYNPTINGFASLPEPDEEFGTKKTTYRMNLAFDPAKSPHYKVVCVEQVELLKEGGFAYYLEVYSSETGVWKVSVKQSFMGPLYSLNGVYWNGSLHWISQMTSESVYFVIEEDRLERLPIPEGLNTQFTYRLWESCDHLNMIAKRPGIQFNIYEMKSDYSEWFIKYQVDLSPIVPSFPGMIQSNPDHYEFSIFSVIRGEKNEDDFLVLQIPGKPIRYSLVSKTFQELHRSFRDDESEESLKLKFPEINGFQYIESLCWV